MVTPLTTTFSPGLVASQLPPCSAARSTITEPSFIEATMSFVMRIGARFPGMSAVVTMMSTSFACAAKSAISASMNSLLITFAYPPSPVPSSSNSSSRNSAPRDSICSLTTGLVSNARTIAPRLLAAPIAASPATPAPIIKTFAGGTLPAAVI